jgi:nucleoid DNA-binding protein
MINRKAQNEVVEQVAKKYNLSLHQANDILFCMSSLIHNVISENKKTGDNYDLALFKTIHITRFGKFIPRPNAIKTTNNLINGKKSNPSVNQ